MGQPKCVCSLKCNAAKKARQHHERNHIGNDLMVHRRQPVVIASRPCSERLEKIIAVGDDIAAVGQQPTTTTEWSGGAKTGHRMRGNTTLEERVRRRFFGYDMPYPPIDFPVISCNYGVAKWFTRDTNISDGFMFCDFIYCRSIWQGIRRLFAATMGARIKMSVTWRSVLVVWTLTIWVWRTKDIAKVYYVISISTTVKFICRSNRKRWNETANETFAVTKSTHKIRITFYSISQMLKCHLPNGQTMHGRSKSNAPLYQLHA